MKTICLSPHLDDAVFSCGGWIWEQTQLGRSVEIWTVCAGDPPEQPLSALAGELHSDWGLGRKAVEIRRQEDLLACGLLGANIRHLPIPDCIYRKSPAGDPYYQTIRDLFGGLDPGESELVEELSRLLAGELPGEALVLVPLSIGNHVDHELTRKAASRTGQDLRYYADYPYASQGEGKKILRIMGDSPEWQLISHPISQTGLEKWIEAARQYDSQIPTFWDNEDQLRSEIEAFSEFLGGMTLWRAVEE